MPEGAEKVIPPPPVLDSARVLFYATVNNAVKFTGRTLLFVDGQELGQVILSQQCIDDNAYLANCFFVRHSDTRSRRCKCSFFINDLIHDAESVLNDNMDSDNVGFCEKPHRSWVS